ncbi:MAG: patatin-like phospholipase family protein [Gemmatimonadota bacterium]
MPKRPDKSLTVEDFTENAEILQLMDELREDLDGKEYSDVVDDEGRQYVDLVMEGGGVLGIALVGYTWVLEEMGIRFLGVAGTSAGSINALLLAALDTRDQKKAVRILELLANLDMYSFVDGDDDARDFIDAALGGAGKFKLAIKGAQIVDNITDHLGLNPGSVFHHWLTTSLGGAGIRTLRGLRDRLEHSPDGLARRDGDAYTLRDPDDLLGVITAEITTETKVQLPRMAPLFWEDPDEVNPADFVRASMSIPFFFHPYRVDGIPQGPEAWARWKEMVSYTGKVPLECVFVDGGIVSNFPIDVFHAPDKVPAAPTLGVKLGKDRQKLREVDGPGKFAGAIFDAARHTLDYDFIIRNPDYRNLVAAIDTRHHHWLNFEMAPSEKVDLFVLGAKRAGRFLRDFDWAGYKKVREGLKAGFEAAPAGG